MKAAIIGASSEALHTIEKAHEYGLTVVALDGNPHAEGLAVADKALVVDISDEKATIEAVNAENVDFVLTVPIGRYLTTIGAVNDALGLQGIGKEMARLCTDKYAFHSKLQEKGLRSCRCYEADAITGALKAGTCGGANMPNIEISYPAILKPRYGSGSRGIYMVENAGQLRDALQAVAGESYVLEECVAGEEYGVDGAVIDGNFHMVLLRHKENTPPPARQAVAYFSVQPDDAFAINVREYMKKIVAHLELSECLIHADIIKGEEGPFVIELSARPSGHNLHNLFTPLCTGVDMAAEYIKYRTGENYCFTPDVTKGMMIHYFDIQGRVLHVPDEEEIRRLLAKAEAADDTCELICWNCTIEEGEELDSVSDGHSLMGRGYFVLEGTSEELLRKKAEEIKKLFHTQK
ncbi:MAG: ATP-grasp domain-containing protein [Lachnospiraceae bacterium]|nr:ATP-grasp domain-containing protein [Lachnospiraceae bacterium]